MLQVLEQLEKSTLQKSLGHAILDAYYKSSKGAPRSCPGECHKPLIAMLTQETQHCPRLVVKAAKLLQLPADDIMPAQARMFLEKLITSDNINIVPDFLQLAANLELRCEEVKRIVSVMIDGNVHMGTERLFKILSSRITHGPECSSECTGIANWKVHTAMQCIVRGMEPKVLRKLVTRFGLTLQHLAAPVNEAADFIVLPNESFTIVDTIDLLQVLVAVVEDAMANEVLLIGLDCEWDPAVVNAPVSLMQLAVLDTEYLVDLQLLIPDPAAAAILERLFGLILGTAALHKVPSSPSRHTSSTVRNCCVREVTHLC